MDMKPKNLLKRVFDFAKAELERRARTSEDASPPEALPQRPKMRADAPREAAPASRPASSANAVQGLEVVRSRPSALSLRWSISPERVAQSRALIEGTAVLCLRIVAFSPTRESVSREVQDRPGIDLSGSCEVSEPSGRGVIALGLRAGERFVSIEHHVL